MKITDAEYELDSDPNFITACKIDGTKVLYAGPKITGWEGPGRGSIFDNILTIVGSGLIDRAAEGYYPEDANTSNIIKFYASRVYHGRLYRQNV